MKFFGINITFIDRSGEEDALKAMRHDDLLNYLASGEGSWDEQDAAAMEAYELRCEMIRRGYLDPDDYPEMQY